MSTAEIESRLSSMREALETTREVIDEDYEPGSVPLSPLEAAANYNWRVGTLLLRLERPEEAITHFQDAVPWIVRVLNSVEEESKWRTAVSRGTRHWCCGILCCSRPGRERVAEAMAALPNDHLQPEYSIAARYHLIKGLAAFIRDNDDGMQNHFESISEDASVWDSRTADGIVAIRDGDEPALTDAVSDLLADHKRRREADNGNLTTASWLVEHRVAILVVLADENGLEVQVEDDFVPDCIARGGYCDG